MFTTYIIRSTKTKNYYIGHTKNMEERLFRHNSGKVKYTKSSRPWVVVHTETYTSRSEAYKRELEIKSYKGGVKFKKLLGAVK